MSKFSPGSGTSGCGSREVASPLEAQEGTVAALLTAKVLKI